MKNEELSLPVYVDELFVAESRNHSAYMVGQRNGHKWCHMWSEDTVALNRVARAIGMKQSWFQGVRELQGGVLWAHYDLTPGKRKLALQHGAIEKPLRDWLEEKLQVGRPGRWEEFWRLVQEEINPARVKKGFAAVSEGDARECFRIIEKLDEPNGTYARKILSYAERPLSRKEFIGTGDTRPAQADLFGAGGAAGAKVSGLGPRH